MRLFPILGCPKLHKIIPWDMIAPHARQAFINHGQSLEIIARRGGLSPCEALAVLEDRAYRVMARDESEQQLQEKVIDYHRVEALMDSIAHRHPSEGESA
jgi:hypothetical protein